MSEPRIKAGIWVQMALRLGASEGHPGMVIRRGDSDAGGVVVLLRGRRGIVALSQTRDSEGRPAWLRATGPDPVDEARADDYTEKQIRFDPDLWVIEFEAPDYLPPFEARLL
ncbi:MAG: DUF1491 family protein [Acidiphilium sp.]|nr:DUF1491 family protein [Acidiphilium sp.]MDD4935365.1 DUF1491 family protein [Acidiphilium sp.]